MSNPRRPEPAGIRHLGTDFALLTKWATAYSRVAPNAYPLCKFTAEEQEILFTAPSCEWRLEHGENGKVTIMRVPIEERRPLDPELKSFLYSPVYQSAMAKEYELASTIEDASPEAEVIAALHYKGAKRWGYNDEAAEGSAKLALDRHLNSAAEALLEERRQLRQKLPQDTGKNSFPTYTILPSGRLANRDGLLSPAGRSVVDGAHKRVSPERPQDIGMMAPPRYATPPSDSFCNAPLCAVDIKAAMDEGDRRRATPERLQDFGMRLTPSYTSSPSNRFRNPPLCAADIKAMIDEADRKRATPERPQWTPGYTTPPADRFRDGPLCAADIKAMIDEDDRKRASQGCPDSIGMITAPTYTSYPLNQAGHHPPTAADMRAMVEQRFTNAIMGRHNGVNQQTVAAQPVFDAKRGSPATSPGVHGSETTVYSLSSGSPPFHSDGSYSPRSVGDSIETITPPTPNFGGGGAPLGPHVHGAGQHRAGDGHLGAGLNKVILNSALSTNSMFLTTTTVTVRAIETVSGYPASQFTHGAIANAQSGFTSQDESEASFVTEKPTPSGIRLAEHQPYKGIMNCYDVPFQGTETLVPEYWTTMDEKVSYAVYKTVSLREEDMRLLEDPAIGAVARNPIHIFVDLSNIIIGFYDSLKTKRGIPIQKRVSPPPFSFNILDAIIRRGREATKKALSGSVGNTWKRRPDYMMQAEELGYEMNILQRVLKPVGPPSKRKSKTKSESAPSGPDSSGDDPRPMKNGEQCVDEVLHVKMLESILDVGEGATECGTIALGSGDAAPAQYSPGFKAVARRALLRGWNVEVYGWRRTMSSAWRDPTFTAQWGPKLRIIELDDFCEELIDLTIESLVQHD